MESPEAWVAPVILAGGFALLWRQIDGLRREASGLRERMARLEGLFAGFTRRQAPGGALPSRASAAHG